MQAAVYGARSAITESEPLDCVGHIAPQSLRIEQFLPRGISLVKACHSLRGFDAARFVFDPGNEPVILPAVSNVSTTAGGSLDFQLHGERMGVRGECWVAQAAGTYFVAVLQTLNPATGNGIRSIGGWGEVYYKLNDYTTFYLGYGIDDPRNQDVGFLTMGPDPNDPGQRTLNQVAWSTIRWDVSDFFHLGFEVSHRETHYVNPLASDEGLLFHFASWLDY